MLIMLPALLIMLSARAQDPYYSQYFNAPLHYNPAYVGYFKGFKTQINYRKQWPQLHDDLKNYGLALDFCERELPGLGGFGLIVNSSSEGAGLIKSLNASLVASSRIKLTKYMVTQAGITAGYVSNQVNVTDYIFSDQIDGKHGLIYPESTFGDLENDKKGYPDIALGGLLSFTRLNISTTAGIALHHVLKPDRSFTGLESRLPRKLVLHTDMIVKQRRAMKKGFVFNPGILFERQGHFSTYQLGMNVARSVLYAGMWYRSKETSFIDYDELVFVMGLKIPIMDENSRLRVMYSYDFGLTGPKGAGGAHEIGMSFEFDKIKLIKSNKSISDDYPVLDNIIRF
jgi:type IX secretion system PorP/SprF family membrane protein